MNTLVFNKELHLNECLEKRMKTYNIVYNKNTKFLQLPVNFFFDRKPIHIPSNDDEVCYLINKNFPEHGEGVDIIIGTVYPNKGHMTLFSRMV